MTPENDPTGWFNGILAAAGLGGGGGVWKILSKQSQHEQRHSAAESRLRVHSDQIARLTEVSVRTETTLSGLGKDIDEIRDGVKVIVNEIAGKKVV